MKHISISSKKPCWSSSFRNTQRIYLWFVFVIWLELLWRYCTNGIIVYMQDLNIVLPK